MRPWREVVQQAARAAALEEARRLWRLDDCPQMGVPFDHRWEHVRTVVALALYLAEQLDADREVVEAAAWLHDVRKLEPNHAQAGAQAAADILAETDFPPQKVPQVVTAIRLHEGLFREEGAPPMEPIEAAILWDADKLSKLGMEALAYALSAPYARGQGLAERRKELTAFTQNVLARTVRSMNTPPARTLAAQRYANMLAALEHWAAEEQIRTEQR